MPTTTDPIDAFADTCERFLALCTDDARPEVERMWSLRSTLGELIAGMDRLPVYTEPYDHDESPTYEEIRRRVGPRYPSLGYYHDVLNLLAVGDPPDTAIGDAIDDLVDTYRELACGLRLLRDGSRREAVGHWRHGFYSHWGSHALGAARAIHEQLQKSGWLASEGDAPGTPRSLG
ncbi:MAG: hypothetical protein HMLKMBBP_00014 [Planctomycetes bacterium]|nr:hypothetical protein [Planctomycetota bacterium]